MSTPRSLLIAWHSQTGASRALADAAARSAQSRARAGVRVTHRHCDEIDAQDIVLADGFLFVVPEMLGSMAGPMKHLFDRTYYAALDRVQGRPYGVIVTAGSDGSGAVRQITRILTGWRLREVAAPLIVCTHAQTPQAILARKRVPAQALEDAAELGAALAEGLALGVW